PRFEMRVVGGDTLGDSAYVVAVIPEPDGDAIAVRFADPGKRLTSGLAIADRARPTPQLLWPDSVTAAWWNTPHTIAFTTTTGGGVRAVVDVHAETLTVVTRPAQQATAPPRAGAPEPRDRERARAWVDSAFVQPGGRPARAGLRYEVDTILPSFDGRWAGFHVVAHDSAGRPSNPAWLLIARDGGGVTELDRITGTASALPAAAAAWSSNGRFFYARGRTVVEVRPEGAVGGAPPGR
ncbi:MAG TPA: hypothetical protein VNA89_01880, partial [Gemmatimonadaceae bacterium]|nr:hypothetical protein [Gemmatimonadaceae bacterium]